MKANTWGLESINTVIGSPRIEMEWDTVEKKKEEPVRRMCKNADGDET